MSHDFFDWLILEAKAEIQKNRSFFGSNENFEICFWDLVTFNEGYSNTSEDYSNTNEDYSHVEGSGSEESANCDDEDDCFYVEIEYTDESRDFPARDFAYY